mmetsp:Transcript_10009/g.40604  ORF Transcript_10009/g.40604 Transcript_10009/m.40604 type:complete len:252 (-) Transcript_10009:397-1152(-)
MHQILDLVLAVSSELLLEPWQRRRLGEDDVRFVAIRQEALDVAHAGRRILAQPRLVVRRAVTVLIVPVEDVAFFAHDAFFELREARRHARGFDLALAHAVRRERVARCGRRRTLRLDLSSEGRDHDGALRVAEQVRGRRGERVEASQQRGVGPQVDVAEEKVRRLDSFDGEVPQSIHRIRRVPREHVGRRGDDPVVDAVAAFGFLGHDLDARRVDGDHDGARPSSADPLEHPQSLGRRLRREREVDRARHG